MPTVVESVLKGITFWKDLVRGIQKNACNIIELALGVKNAENVQMGSSWTRTPNVSLLSQDVFMIKEDAFLATTHS